MQLFRFDREAGRAIDRFGSVGFGLTNIARLAAPASVRCAYLQPGGVIGYHPAASAQLLLVVHGAGQVRGEGEAWQAITTGQAAFWETGEWHETRTEAGLTAFIIEAETLDPAALMPRL